MASHPPDRPTTTRASARSVLALSVVFLALAFAVAACSGGSTSNQAEKVSLAHIAENQQQYSGRRVTTTGTVRKFGQGANTYFVIEDAARNRVEVQPTERFADQVGEKVTVTGRFTFSDTRGRSLVATSVRPAT